MRHAHRAKVGTRFTIVLLVIRYLSEYLVNIGLGRGTAQKRVTGGRWRRIVLGGVLAGQVVELGGSPRLWP